METCKSTLIMKKYICRKNVSCSPVDVAKAGQNNTKIYYVSGLWKSIAS